MYRALTNSNLFLNLWRAALIGAIILMLSTPSYAGGVKHYHQGKVQVVEIPPGILQASIVLGENHLGGTESLASMASRSRAVVAINGTYFSAYGGRPDPWNNLVMNGQAIHTGSTGTTIGITRSGEVKMAPVKMKILGAINGSYSWPNNWYAYGFNHTPSSNGIFIYTAKRGKSLGFAKGSSVIVRDGVVVGKAFSEDVSIPVDGYVINFSGSEQSLAERFNLGDRVEYNVVLENTCGEDWSQVITAVGAGPRLLTDGEITVNPKGEGFTQAKIIIGGGARSAIGVKADGTILLVTTQATIKQLAEIMKKLGAYNAMCLDGGASSGLWLQGKYLTKPGRLLSNALIFK